LGTFFGFFLSCATAAIPKNPRSDPIIIFGAFLIKSFLVNLLTSFRLVFVSLQFNSPLHYKTGTRTGFEPVILYLGMQKPMTDTLQFSILLGRSRILSGNHRCLNPSATSLPYSSFFFDFFLRLYNIHKSRATAMQFDLLTSLC